MLSVLYIDPSGARRMIPGPPDLHRISPEPGSRLFITGDLDDLAHTHWAYVVGAYVLRGGRVERTLP